MPMLHELREDCVDALDQALLFAAECTTKRKTLQRPGMSVWMGPRNRWRCAGANHPQLGDFGQVRKTLGIAAHSKAKIPRNLSLVQHSRVLRFRTVSFVHFFSAKEMDNKAPSRTFLGQE